MSGRIGGLLVVFEWRLSVCDEVRNALRVLGGAGNDEEGVVYAVVACAKVDTPRNAIIWSSMLLKLCPNAMLAFILVLNRYLSLAHYRTRIPGSHVQSAF